MFSKTLNAVQQEDQKKKAIKDARTEHMKNQFETAVSKGHLDCTDAAALYTLTIPIGLLKISRIISRSLS